MRIASRVSDFTEDAVRDFGIYTKISDRRQLHPKFIRRLEVVISRSKPFHVISSRSKSIQVIPSRYKSFQIQPGNA